MGMTSNPDCAPRQDAWNEQRDRTALVGLLEPSDYQGTTD